MTGLRIELRRSTALWAGLLVLVAGTGMLSLMTHETSRWNGNSTSAVLELRQSLAYVWSLVVGLAVFQGMRDSRSQVTELFTATSRPAWVRLGTLAAAVSGVVAVATALLCAVLVAKVAFGGGFVSLGFLPLAAAVVLAMASSVLMGLAIGRLLPHPLTVPVALVGTFMLTTMASQVLDFSSPGAEISRFALLTPKVPVTNSDLVTTSTSVDLGQVLWFAGLGVTAFLLLVSRTVPTRLAALVPAGLALVLAMSVMPAKYSDVLVSDSIASKLVCDGAVCVSQAHENKLTVAASAGRAALAKLAVLPDAPKEVREDTSAMAHLTPLPRDPRIVYVSPDGLLPPLNMTEDQLRLEMLAGAGVAACTGPNGYRLSEGIVRHVMAGYFHGELAPLASDRHLLQGGQTRTDAEQAWRQFRGRSAREQLNSVVQARRMLLTCQDSDRTLDVLKGT